MPGENLPSEHFITIKSQILDGFDNLPLLAPPFFRINR